MTSSSYCLLPVNPTDSWLHGTNIWMFEPVDGAPHRNLEVRSPPARASDRKRHANRKPTRQGLSLAVGSYAFAEGDASLTSRRPELMLYERRLRYPRPNRENRRGGRWER